MILLIETSDQNAIEALKELAKSLNLVLQIQDDLDTVSEEERLRRMNIVQQYKGGLKKHFTGYQPDKHEWYQQ